MHVDDSVAMLRPRRLRAGDQVRLVSPASPAARDGVEVTVRFLEGLGLRPSLGAHVFDEYGYLAGTDADRLADVNDALRDPQVAAIVATRGGKGAYRIAAGLDVAAAARYPTLLVGFSELTMLHLALWRGCRLAGVHGAPFEVSWAGPAATASFLLAVFTTDPVTVTSRPGEPTGVLTTTGQATGVLLGGNQDMVATAAGWALPDLGGAILLLEAVDMRLGHIDRQLTMLLESGRLAGVRGVAVGQYTSCGARPVMRAAGRCWMCCGIGWAGLGYRSWVVCRSGTARSRSRCRSAR